MNTAERKRIWGVYSCAHAFEGKVWEIHCWGLDKVMYGTEAVRRKWLILVKYSSWRGPGSSVGIATGYGLDGQWIESRRGEIFRTCPDRPWGPPSLMYNGYRVFPGVNPKVNSLHSQERVPSLYPHPDKSSPYHISLRLILILSPFARRSSTRLKLSNLRM